jgi:hypothetical protein
MVGFVEDKRGAIAIQVALFIPILVILLLGAYELWKALYMQQVINDAAYQGVRLMAMQPLGQDRAGNNTEIIAEQMIRRYISQAALVDPAFRENPGDPRLEVRFQSERGYFCGSRILVRITMPWTVGREWGVGVSSSWLPFLGLTWTMRGQAEGWILCERAIDVGG